MSLRKRFRDFRDWCPQPPDRLPTKLKRYSMPIAAVVTATLILSVTFLAFSSSLMPSAPIVPLVNAPVSATPTLLWKYNISAFEGLYGASSPVVVNGVVYTSEENNYVYALNATDGTQLWDYFTGEWPSSPAVANGVVYVNTEFSINALNATDGTQLWRNEPQYDVPVGFSSPTVADGIVYAGTTNSSDNGDCNVYAINATNGKTLWSTPSLAGYAIVNPSPAVANGTVYIGAEGAFGWAIPAGYPIAQICYGVYAFNATSGAQLWNYNTDYSGWSPPVVAGGVVYYVSEENNLYAINATSGAEIWNYTPVYTGSGNGVSLENVDSSPAVVDGVVYLGSDYGNVYAFNSSSGTIIWNCTIGDGTLSTPTVADGVLYVGSTDNNIYTLNATNGVELWSYPTSGAVDSPAVVNGVLYVGGGNNIYALRVTPTTSPSSKQSNPLPIIIGVVAAVLIVATVVLLTSQKGLKTKTASSPNTQDSSSIVSGQIYKGKIAGE